LTVLVGLVWCQGQICMTAGRHIVHSSIADEYISTLAQKAAQIRVGDPTDYNNALGPLIDEKQRDKVHSIVTTSLEHGARLVTGGEYDDLCYRPTVLADVTVDSPAYRQEIFGPVAPVITYDTIEEAIELINDSEYGLTVGILTGNAFAAFELADRIKSGMGEIPLLRFLRSPVGTGRPDDARFHGQGGPSVQGPPDDGQGHHAPVSDRDPIAGLARSLRVTEDRVEAPPPLRRRRYRGSGAGYPVGPCRDEGPDQLGGAGGFHGDPRPQARHQHPTPHRGICRITRICSLSSRTMRLAVPAAGRSPRSTPWSPATAGS
jgi:hypothetical protein